MHQFDESLVTKMKETARRHPNDPEKGLARTAVRQMG